MGKPLTTTETVPPSAAPTSTFTPAISELGTCQVMGASTTGWEILLKRTGSTGSGNYVVAYALRDADEEILGTARRKSRRGPVVLGQSQQQDQGCRVLRHSAPRTRSGGVYGWTWLHRLRVVSTPVGRSGTYSYCPYPNVVQYSGSITAVHRSLNGPRWPRGKISSPR